MAEYPEVLLDVAECLSQSMERKGLSAETAADLAFEAVEALRIRWGGMDLYIPKAKHLDNAPRNQVIYEKWKAGASLIDLARNHSCSVQWIRQIVMAARASRPKLQTAQVNQPA